MNLDNKIKVLWFSNTPANADEYFNSELKGTGGWLKALDQALQKHVDLHIAFYSKEDKVFQYKQSNYYSLKWKNSVISKIKERYFGVVLDKEDLDRYLLLINEVKPDIIHIHGTENPFGCFIPYVKIPVVVSIQGNITVCNQKFLSGFEKKYLRVKNRSFSSLKDFFLARSFLQSFKLFSKMHVRELNNLKHVRNILGRTAWDRRITSIMAPNSAYYHSDEILRDSFYDHKWLPIKTSKTILFTTNGNTIYKGFETICEALYELNILGLNYQWHVAGINTSDLIVKVTKKKLKDKYPKEGLVLLGNLNEKELVAELLNANIYIMPSHIENSPNNLSEAMLLGMPCISTFVGGVGALITDKVDGILIQSGDPWCMAGAILELINNQDYAIELGKNARISAVKRHNKGKIVNGLIDNYKHILIEHKNNS
jgi:glycosyltransferase involved in cell wall biosynthesis